MTRPDPSAPGQPQDGWQDIGTAPRDGTAVLVANADDMAIAYWFWHRLQLVHAGGYAEDSDLPFEPTHWRPRPALPARAAP